MLKIMNGIEISESGSYYASVHVDGVELTFHVNSKKFSDEELNELAHDVIAELRKQDDVVFYERDEDGHRRYSDLQSHSNEVWQELLQDNTARVFFFLWRLI